MLLQQTMKLSATFGSICRLMLLLTVFCIGYLSLKAQTTKRSVTGASFYSEEYLRGLIRGESPDSARIILQSAYHSAGFLNTSIAIDSLGNVAVTEGDRYTISTLTITPDSISQLVRDNPLELPGLVEGYFTSEDVNQFLQDMIRLLNERGYPLAVARVAGIDVNDSLHSVSLRIDVERGDRVVISEIDVRGNTETSRDLIVVAAALEPDQKFSDELAGQVRSRLQRLNVFSEVEEPQLYRTDSGTYGLLLTVREGNPNTFDGIVGYQPGETINDAGYFTGLINVVLRNLGGTGRRLQVRGDWPKRNTRELEARYGEPFFLHEWLGLPLDIEIGYKLRQEATTEFLLSYVQHFLSGDVYYGLSDEVSVRLGGALEQTLPEADTSQPCFKQLLNTSVLESTFGIVYDSRSDRINPVNGLRFSATYSVGARNIRGPFPCDTGLPRSNTRQRNDLDIEGYLPLGGPFVLASGLHGGDIRGDLLQEADLYTFGGQSTVRGYRENFFRAARRAWGNLEGRFLLARTSYVSLFIDGGYYLRPADTLRSIAEEEQWIYGYGIAGQVETPLGLVRLSFALGKDDTFETGKIFVGLLNQF